MDTEDYQSSMNVLGFESCPEVCVFNYNKMCYKRQDLQQGVSNNTFGSANLSIMSDYDYYNNKPFGIEAYIRPQEDFQTISNLTYLHVGAQGVPQVCRYFYFPYYLEWTLDIEERIRKRASVLEKLCSKPSFVAADESNKHNESFSTSSEDSSSSPDNWEPCPTPKRIASSDESRECETVTLELSSSAAQDINKTLHNLASVLDTQFKLKYITPKVETYIPSTSTEESLSKKQKTDQRDDENNEISASSRVTEEAILPNSDNNVAGSSPMYSLLGPYSPISDAEEGDCDTFQFEKEKMPEPCPGNTGQPSKKCQNCGVPILNDTIMQLKNCLKDIIPYDDATDSTKIYFCSDNCFTLFAKYSGNHVLSSWKDPTV